MGAFLQFMRPKTKLFAVKFRCILEVLTLRGLWKKFRVHYHNLCVQKLNCLPWCSDAFWKFSACKVCREFWTNFHGLCVHKRTCYCEVQMHLEGFCL